MEVERVQEIATLSNLKGTIPSEFIRLENEQPATTTLHGVKLEVPVIDFSQTDNESLADLISKASKRLGVIFKWVNPGDYPSEVISKLQNVGKDFLWYHKKEKEVIAKPNGYKGVEGYGTKLQKEVQGKKGWVDHLFHVIWPPSAINYHFWPKNPPTYRFIKYMLLSFPVYIKSST
ncbi:flavonol synthase [Tanacetum coccineum]